MAKNQENENVISTETQTNKGVSEILLEDDEINLIKNNLLKLTKYLQILGQTTEQFELAKNNILQQISNCREEHEKITGLILKKNGLDEKSRVIDIDYDNKKIKIVKN